MIHSPEAGCKLREETNKPQTAEKWHESFKIRSFEVGTQGLVTPQTLCRLLQEAAGNHAARLNVAAEELAARDLMWVLSRLRLEMQRTPSWHETIRIQTWPTTRSTGVRAHRDFQLFGGPEQLIGPELLIEQGHLIGQASSMWLLLNRKNRRPMKIPEFLLPARLDGLDDDLLADFKIPDLKHEVEFERRFEVRISDLDYNQHVNNVCYLSWAVDTLPLAFIEGHQLADLQISCLNEGQYGETIISRAARSAKPSGSTGLNPTFVHELSEKASGRNLAIVRTTWKANP